MAELGRIELPPQERTVGKSVKQEVRLMLRCLKNATFLCCFLVLFESPATTNADPAWEQDARVAKGGDRQVSFDDDFDDGNTDGWVFLPNRTWGTEPNWLVENQTLAQLSLGTTTQDLSKVSWSATKQPKPTYGLATPAITVV